MGIETLFLLHNKIKLKLILSFYWSRIEVKSLQFQYGTLVLQKNLYFRFDKIVFKKRLAYFKSPKLSYRLV